MMKKSYVDDVNGGFLDLEMVREARVEELAGYLKMQVHCRVPVSECGSHGWWRREVKKRNNTEEESANFFASTPPLGAVKFLI